MRPNRMKVYSSSSIDQKMNTYLFCTLLFILTMKSSHALSLYRNDRQSIETFRSYIPSDELNVVLSEADENAEIEKMKKELADAHIEPIFNQNFSYMAAFVSESSTDVLCHGALIDPSWVLTSASCLKKYNMSLDAVGVISGFHLPRIEISEIKCIVFHPDFKILTNQNDIALVELYPPLVNLTPIALTNSKDPKTAKCDFSAIYNYSMIAFHVDMVSTHDCMRKELPKQNLSYYCAGLNGRQIELTRDDMLGVPLVCSGELYGIKSVKTIFTSVPGVYDWIEETMKNPPATVDRVPTYTSVMNSADSESQQSKPQDINVEGSVNTNKYVTESSDVNDTATTVYKV